MDGDGGGVGWGGISERRRDGGGRQGVVKERERECVCEYVCRYVCLCMCACVYECVRVVCMYVCVCV